MDKTVVLLGNFDGVHIGHQELISIGRSEADKRGLPLTVWTFDKVFPPALTPESVRAELLRSYGVDRIVTESFGKVKDLSPSEFVRRILKNSLGAALCVCGYNYSFGRGGKGDPELLSKLCSENGMESITVGKVTIEGENISSSDIRTKLISGDAEGAGRLLGRPWFVIGSVIKGAQKGRTVGMPTANICPNGICLPKNGVYATLTTLPSGERLPSVTNVGVRPTVSDGRGVTVETHIMGYDGDLYGQEIKVEFLSFLREERQFASLSDVFSAVKSDIKNAEAISEKFIK